MKTKTMKTKTMKTKTMKTKSILSLACALVLLCLGGQANAALTITNGDFQDLTGLTAQPGAPGWYQGVPAGWSSSTTNQNYNVVNYSSGNIGANIETLGPISPSFAPLYQNAGLLDSAGKVTLTFNVLGLSAEYSMVAAIYNATSGGSPTTWTALTSATYNQTSGSLQTLDVSGVAAFTPIAIAFWHNGGGGVGVDNVSVIPEPSSYALMLGGIASLLLLRLLRHRVQS